MTRSLLFILISSLGAFAAPALTCASCHQAESASQPHTGMGQALQSAAASPMLQSHKKLTFRQDPYVYSVDRDGERSWYSVTDGKDQFRAPVSWSFGLGSAGQTYLIQRNGTWYESRVSYYRDTDSLDLTTGARKDLPRTLDEAIGRELSKKGAEECFNCHSTGAVIKGELRTESLAPGIQCERCHDGAAKHLASFQKSGDAKMVPAKLGASTAEEMSEFCGQCHRTWSQIATNGPHNITNVRFQPYRLTNSKCYDVTDARIRCTACHNPHQEVQRTASFYDARCTACHSTSGKAGAHLCKVAQKDCVTCHMPKVRIAETHNAFTDHWIRIARTGDPYPN